MAYETKSQKSGKTYHLHMKDVTLKGGQKQRIYYFAGAPGPNTCDMPAGYVKTENPRTGLPLLKKG